MEIFREQAEILHILFNSTHPVNGATLAKLVGSSLKTIKKEADKLSSISQQYGFEIVSKSGMGYEIEVFDDDAYNAFRFYVEKKKRHGLFFYDSSRERVHFLLRLLLTNQYTTIDEMSEKCNCSESTIRRDLFTVSVKKRIEEYGLSLNNKQGYGYSIDGDEWLKRQALITEHYLYLNFHKVFFKDQEPYFEQMFFNNGILTDILQKRIEKVTVGANYILSPDAVKRVKFLIILAVTRQKYAQYIKHNENLNPEAVKIEMELLKVILNSLPGFENVTLGYEDIIHLAYYIKSEHIVRYFEFAEEPVHDYIENLVRGFIDILDEKMGFKGTDSTVLFKDLCGELYRLYYRSVIGSHIFRNKAIPYTIDGANTLDICSLMYLYLKEKTGWNCNTNDVAMLYPTFSYYTYQRDKDLTHEVYIVSDLGYFAARNYASNLQLQSTDDRITYIPVGYLSLDTIDKKRIAAILTDVPELISQDMDVPVIDLYYMHNREGINRLRNLILEKRNVFQDYFTVDDIYYVDEFYDEEEMFGYVHDVCLKEYGEKADDFIREAELNYSVYHGARKNCCCLINPFNDYLDDTFIKVILLKKPLYIGNNRVTKVIVSNSKGSSSMKRVIRNNHVVNLMHDITFVESGDRLDDYEKLCFIMYT